MYYIYISIMNMYIDSIYYKYKQCIYKWFKPWSSESSFKARIRKIMSGASSRIDSPQHNCCLNNMAAWDLSKVSNLPASWGSEGWFWDLFLLKIIDESKNGIVSAIFGEGLDKTSQMSKFIPEQWELCSRKQQTSLVGSTNKDVSLTWYTRLD